MVYFFSAQIMYSMMKLVLNLAGLVGVYFSLLQELNYYLIA